MPKAPSTATLTATTEVVGFGLGVGVGFRLGLGVGFRQLHRLLGSGRYADPVPGGGRA